MPKNNKPKQITDLKTVGTSFVVSISDVSLNLIISIVTGSTVMLSQALQGLSDLTTAGILFYGVRRSKRQPDDKHHFGYGREVFFYVLLAGMFMFIGTGGLSVYFGVQQILDPEPVRRTWLALAMLTFGLLTNAYACSLSVRRLGLGLKSLKSVRKIIRSSMVETKATFIIDLLGTIAALFGLIALGLYLLTDFALFDGIGSVVIGVSMMIGASLLMFDAKDLIVGRAIAPSTLEAIKATVRDHVSVRDVLDLKTMFIGSGKILVIAEVHFADGLETNEIEQISDELKINIKRLSPSIKNVQIEAETPDSELA